MTKKRIAIIGSGFAGLSSAAYLAQSGHEAHVFEKNEQLGGRASVYTEGGFRFDMGPSWYWMPDVFESFYADFGAKTSDFYQLQRLNPSYRVYWQGNEHWDIPASMNRIEEMFEKLETGASAKLRQFISEAKYKYDTGMNDFVQRPSYSWLEYINIKTVRASFQLDLFQSISKHIRKYFKHPQLISLLEFPVLFLGAKPQNTPALYSLMNYADLALGTWYPMGGMNKIVEAFETIGKSQGVYYHLNHEVTRISPSTHQIDLTVNGASERFDFVISAADYHHTEQQLLRRDQANYQPKYWNSRTMAPSSLLFYLGINKKIPELKHHSLFFDSSFAQHAIEIYDTHRWPSDPLFYACCPSKTDPSVAPDGMENLFLLMPISTRIEDSEEMRLKYYDQMMNRIEQRLGIDLRSHVITSKSFCIKDFISRYHSFRGNAYGLANTLRQTGAWKPKIRNRKYKNLYYAGQLTVPGPGVPPSIISGKIAAREVLKSIEDG